ncbi:hypothetical protein D3875_18240 [Deinococcus cavernae]|uniref:Uncharacterized protein n=1 Tax=Deinococcus cavernae TaxID=2320857 RepID=A0A418VB08_9DEIO|nr:hypothetical protein D3875_18240 [Deinococcus cavernae]
MLMGDELRRGHIPEAGVEPFGVVKGNEPPTMLAGFIQIGVILSIDLFQGFEEEFPFWTCWVQCPPLSGLRYTPLLAQ